MNNNPNNNSDIFFKSYEDVMSFLDSRGLFRVDYTLNRMYTAIKDLIPANNMHIVQIIGTNGKGSTSTFLSNIGIAHEIKTGLFTSPHFISPRERILIDNKMLEESDFVYFANKIFNKIQTLTYFEFMTIMAYLAFYTHKVELAFMEAGLGGHRDATTAMPVHTICYTPIDLDHQHVLGDTIQKIATDKSLAIRSNAPIITAQQQAIALDCLKKQSLKFDAPIHVVEKISPKHKEHNLRLKGQHQQENACLALKTWHEIAKQNNWDNSPTLCTKAINEAFIAGRLQHIAASATCPALLLDGAHNYHGLLSLKKYLAENNFNIIGIIFCCMEDKDSAEITKLISTIANNKPIFVPHIANNARVENNEFLAKLLGNNAKAIPNLSIALEHFSRMEKTTKSTLNNNSDKSLILVCGSLYLLAEFFKLYPEHLLSSKI